MKNNTHNCLCTIPFDKYFKTKSIIVHCTQGEKDFYFILDSGASHSCLSQQRIDEIEYQMQEGKTILTDIRGNKKEVDSCEASLNFGEMKTKISFLINDFTGAFDGLEQFLGIHIHGLLGTNFLLDHKAIVDYEKLELRLYK